MWTFHFSHINTFRRVLSETTAPFYLYLTDRRNIKKKLNSSLTSTLLAAMRLQDTQLQHTHSILFRSTLRNILKAKDRRCLYRRHYFKMQLHEWGAGMHENANFSPFFRVRWGFYSNPAWQPSEIAKSNCRETKVQHLYSYGFHIKTPFHSFILRVWQLSPYFLSRWTPCNWSQHNIFFSLFHDVITSSNK